jgi:hypothetical protein
MLVAGAEQGADEARRARERGAAVARGAEVVGMRAGVLEGHAGPLSVGHAALTCGRDKTSGAADRSGGALARGYEAGLSRSSEVCGASSWRRRRCRRRG